MKTMLFTASWVRRPKPYYYQSEEAISAVTAGAKEVAQGYGIEFGSLNTAPGLTAAGDDRYDNFNSAWNYSSGAADASGRTEDGDCRRQIRGA